MNRTAPLLLAAALLSAGPAPADESLDDVLARHYEAVGGIDAWKAVENCRMTGRLAMPQGMEAPFAMTFLRPMKTRLEFSAQGMTGIQVYDGEKAWAILPFGGSTEPQIMPEEHAKIMREQSDFDGPLMDWQEKGNQVELVGKESDEGVYHLKVTLDSGDVRHYFLDAESYLPTRLEATAMVQGNEMAIETSFRDYRRVGDLLMPHTIESKPKGAPGGQVLSFDTVEINVELAEDLFLMPGADATVAPKKATSDDS